MLKVAGVDRGSMGRFGYYNDYECRRTHIIHTYTHPSTHNSMHVLTLTEYAGTQNRAIEALLQRRLDLLRRHDAAFRCVVDLDWLEMWR